MSLRAILWVMNDAPVKDSTELVILYALADRASDDGTTAWPSQEWIADKSRCSVRTVRRHLKAMEQRGLIKLGNPKFVEHVRPDKRPTVWDLNLQMTRADNLTGRTNEVERADIGGITGGHSGSSDRTNGVERPDTGVRQTVLNPPEPPLNRPEPLASDFDQSFAQFWSAYPKKTGKGQARTAYKTALKKITADELDKHLAVFVAHHREQGTDKKFIPNPATWLNGERWEDELVASRSAGGERYGSVVHIAARLREERASGDF